MSSSTSQASQALKRYGYIILLLLVILGFNCKKLVTMDDVNDGDSRWMNISVVSAMEPGKTTMKEILERAGKPYRVQSFRPAFPQKLGDRYFPVDKLVVYFSTKGSSTKIPAGQAYSNHEKQVVVFYINDGVLSKSLVRHTIKDALSNQWILGPETTPEMRRYFEEISESDIYPYAGCVNAYYKKYMVLGDTLGLEAGCYWNTHTFASELQRAGYGTD